ncbi:ABC transporter permease subunit [Nonomuraea angiospora]|uniref:ABC transporter permease subunit n=1 Tax=Nonomuraea angiospora TaxID=46172 RepID=UPI00331D01D7
MSGLTFGRVVRAEWTKLFALRSTWVVLGVVPQLLVGLAALIGWNTSGAASGAAAAPGGVTQAVGGGFLVFAVVFGVFGALVMTGEYGSGLIGATLAAVPRRLPVLWAKAVVLVVTTGPLMVVTSLLAFLANQAFAAHPITLGDPGVVRAILGVSAAGVAVALLGLAIGTMLRHTAAAVPVYLGVLVLLPPVLLAALPGAVRETVLPYLPTLALQAMYHVGDDGVPVLGPVAGTAVSLAWVAVALAGAAVLLRRRDA